MTNAEKFKEDFGHEPNTNCPFDVYCPQCKWNNGRTDCISKFWHSEYQGTSTIPLSVVEKIEKKLWEKIDKILDYDGLITETMNTRSDAYHECISMIAKAVKECTHDKG